MIGILISLLILAAVCWVLSMILDLLLPLMEAPAGVKRIIVAIVGICGLVSILAGWRGGLGPP